MVRLSASPASSSHQATSSLSPAQRALVEAQLGEVVKLLNCRFLKRSARHLGDEEALSVAHRALCEAALRHHRPPQDFAAVAARAVRRAVRAQHRRERGRPDRAAGEGKSRRKGGEEENKAAKIRWRSAADRLWREWRRRAAVHERFREVKAEMKKLSRAQQRVLDAAFWGRLGPTEVAESWGLDVRAVRDNYREAILALRRALGVSVDAHPVPPWRDPPRQARRMGRGEVSPPGTNGEATS